jgi:uncharacterized protein (TIGR00297 family)
VLAAVIAVLARLSSALTTGGAVVAAAVGTLAVAAGWSWAALLIAFFITSVALSRIGATRKAGEISSIIAKPGARDAAQVLANGGVFAVAALLWVVTANIVWFAAAAGALAASAADTWGTEIGVLSRAEPRMISSWRRVRAGTSGAVSAWGVAGSAGGAALIAAVAWAFNNDLTLSMAIFAGGLAGAVSDSLVGAHLQERRWCDECQVATERVVHGCGTRTRHVGGLARLDNEGVNLLCSLVGALVAGAIFA